MMKIPTLGSPMERDWKSVASHQSTASKKSERNVVLQPIPGFVIVIAKISRLI